ncbi:uncharacterized protein MYCFIDRAFT_207706 [Pseudocercospora fijiensis CIRAD86]|uniref:Uncharacterized protein n=1 Tax=Pseudocercospora fijiensis (strain CIRAD86) TaxID=383855 RepID=M2ZVX7_PSEFD|nr:uncharacterized protein MYCFIDRAFT_207706 [Pseudocercospora fijiensis CIRAD86]EME83149.1 hypothetical protein MYCFIDRAFT_207706 [Pseudocercospora fijiensis CIRAD86]
MYWRPQCCAEIASNRRNQQTCSHGSLHSYDRNSSPRPTTLAVSPINVPGMTELYRYRGSSSSDELVKLTSPVSVIHHISMGNKSKAVTIVEETSPAMSPWVRALRHVNQVRDSESSYGSSVAATLLCNLEANPNRYGERVSFHNVFIGTPALELLTVPPGFDGVQKPGANAFGVMQDACRKVVMMRKQ